MDLGTKLKQARQSRNVTQETLAERLGVSRQTISNWENNRSYPDIVSIIALSDLYVERRSQNDRTSTATDEYCKKPAAAF